jgi:nitrate/TMAO reductase-like tetraheme cytochrome c subunit
MILDKQTPKITPPTHPQDHIFRASQGSSQPWHAPPPSLGKRSKTPGDSKRRALLPRYRKLTGWPSLTIDLDRPRHWRNLIFVFAGLVLIGAIVPIGGFTVYQYTNSAEFCGSVCHPMESVFLHYERSPHANVKCTECHIGPGLLPFVKAKIAGTRELYALSTNTYSRPIQSPVHDLRPARETCEECHIPTSFKDNIIKTVAHYENDEANTPVQSTLILKMDGWQDSTGKSAGIHWHTTNQVYYIVADEQRQSISWMGVQQDDGSLKEFYARDTLTMPTSFVDEARANGEVRLMDCIDCHNRTAHLIPPPEVIVDKTISAGLISTDLPYIKAKAVQVLTSKYASEAEAFEAIYGLEDFYRLNYPEVYANYRSELDAAIAELEKIYSDTNFLDMELDWQTNPNNERHSASLGCFRCHDDNHIVIDSAGDEQESVSAKCNLCHTVPIVGRGDDILVEAPVIVGVVPDSHTDFSWTVEHRTMTEVEEQDCYSCHGQGFCNNSACHNLSHPPDMLYAHANECRRTGDQICRTCHQDVLCDRCHSGNISANH